MSNDNSKNVFEKIGLPKNPVMLAPLAGVSDYPFRIVCEQLGADLDKTIMAVAWGDAWTNMLQPFWAVPLLTIAGMKIKDIIGLLLVVLLCSGLVLSAVFLLA